MASISISTDFERWPEVKALTHAGKTADEALLIAIRLMRELADLAPVTRQVGVVPANIIGQVAKDVGADPGILTGGTCPLLVEAADGGFVWTRFAEANRHLDPGFRPAHQKGADLSRHRRDLRKYSGSVVAQSLFIPVSWLQTDGVAWDSGFTRTVMMTIRALDNAIGLPARTPTEAGYTEGLLAAAAALLRKEGWDAIALVAEHLIGLTHPVIPRSTEKLIEAFESLKTIPELKAAIGRTATR